LLALNVKSSSDEQTRGLAEKLAPSFLAGDVLVLAGELGSGKTEFVKGLARAYGVDEDYVNSPSYTFVNEYPGERPIYHFDLYRMSDPSELYEIGWDEYLGRNGLVVVEWGDKAEGLLPRRYYRLEFSILSENEREVSIFTVGHEPLD
jgi:tRNA threonylcarbamoyladenosine biosynthesis protein TsaE